MVSVDIYLNETTRHADVILPPPSHLERSHYDMVFTAFSIRNVANFSEAVFERDADQPDEALDASLRAVGSPPHRTRGSPDVCTRHSRRMGQ
mgnify:CR=1 FL=1